MKPADLLTFLRLALVPLFVMAAFAPLSHRDYLATGVFLAAAVTDGLDGYLARRRGEVTPLGEFLDPLVDKALICTATVALMVLGRWPVWAGVVLIVREVAVTGLRVVGMRRGRRLPVSLWGKLKTLSQVAAVVAGLVPVVSWLRFGLLALAVGVTVASGVHYFRRHAR